jgi:GntR family transcriptional regulator
VKIDRNTPIPLYYQLKQHFLGQITSGELVVGDRLPSEEEVIEQSGLSRFTVRQAFQALEREGLVERTRGKGTFVRAPRVQLSVAWQLIGFSDDMRQKGHKVTSEVIGLSVQPCTVEDAAKHLGLALDALVVHMDRTRKVDSFPLVFDSVSVRADMFEGLEEMDLTDASLFHVLEDHYSVSVIRAHRSLSIGKAEPVVAEFFGVEPESPVFILTDLAFAEDDVPIFFARTAINQRRSQFEFELFRDAVARDTYAMSNSVQPVLRTRPKPK